MTVRPKEGCVVLLPGLACQTHTGMSPGGMVKKTCQKEPVSATTEPVTKPKVCKQQDTRLFPVWAVNMWWWGVRCDRFLAVFQPQRPAGNSTSVSRVFRLLQV